MTGSVKKIVLSADVLVDLLGYLTGTEELGPGTRVIGGDLRLRTAPAEHMQLRLILANNEFPMVDGDPPRIELGELDAEKASELRQAIVSRREGTEEAIRELVRSEIEKIGRGADGTEGTGTEANLEHPENGEATEGA